MNILEASQASGLAADTIRFYERKDVLPRPPRHANGYRNYTGEHVATLRLARGLRQLNVPLEDVRPILEVAHEGVCGDIRGRLIDTLSSVRVDIDAQLADLRNTRRHVLQLLSGLHAMGQEESDIPGAIPCHCVDLVMES